MIKDIIERHRNNSFDALEDENLRNKSNSSTDTPNLTSESKNNKILETQQGIIIIGGVIFYGPRFAEELATHFLSVPISEFNNAELAHVATESRRRAAYDILRAREKDRRHTVVIPRLNYRRIFSKSSINIRIDSNVSSQYV
jgi:hypothetical protein